MLRVSPRLFPSRIGSLGLLFGGLILVAVAPVTVRAQRNRAPVAEPEDRPAFSEFKGVRLGMPIDEARKKLGDPRDKSPEQDFYMFGENEAVQVFYDKAGTVSAISIDFMSGANPIPSAKEVLGTEAEMRPDGSVYKMLRYPKAGYWVSYNRAAGADPTTTVTMQKIEH